MDLLGDLAHRELGAFRDGEAAARAHLEVGARAAPGPDRVVGAKALADGERGSAAAGREADHVAHHGDDDRLVDPRLLPSRRRGHLRGRPVEGAAEQEPRACQEHHDDGGGLENGPDAPRAHQAGAGRFAPGHRR